MRVIMRQSDLGTIQEFRETLRQSLDLFGVSPDQFEAVLSNGSPDS